MRRCRAVIFDLDDTLVPTSRIDRAAILSAAVKALSGGDGTKPAARFAELLKAEPFPPESSGQDVPSWRSMLWERALQGSGASEAARLAYDTWCAERLGNFKFSSEVVSMVQRLQEAGYKTGILTNGHADVQRAKTAACDATGLFGEKVVIVAGEHPEQKPHASIFRTACTALGEPESATVMVGDSYAADITGGINAKLLGTIWIRPPSAEGAENGSLMHGHLSAVPPGQPSPSYTVGSVLDVEACLREIG
jgi:HAD superfamily hydrolase (TIGR01549 family)